MSDYESTRKKFSDMITLYGRKPVLEILSDPGIAVFRLHLASSNAASDILRQIETLAADRGIEIQYHDRPALARISKNGRQDQGVAVDVEPPGYRDIEAIDTDCRELIALDGITNPQNLGMIIRTVAASPLEGLVLPKKGCARINPLVHKASAGTLFRAEIYHSPTLEHAISRLKARDFEVIGLSGAAEKSIADISPVSPGSRVFLLGNESEGLRPNILEMCHETVAIPMARDIESLNVTAAAALVAFRGLFS